MSLELKARLTLDRRGFVQGMNFSKQEVQNWNRVLAKNSQQTTTGIRGAWAATWAAIAAGAAVAVRGVSSALRFGGKFQDMADRLGMDPEKLQQWGFEANQTGSTAEAVTLAIQRLAVAGQQALGGSDEFAGALDRLGLSMEDIRNLTLEEQFELLRMGMRGAKIDGEKLADIIKVLGRGAGELIPFLKSGPSFEGRGLANTKETIAGLDAIGDELNSQKAFWGGAFRDLTEKALTPVMDFLFAGKVSRRKKSNLAALDETERKALAEGSAREEAKAQADADKEAKKREAEEAKKAERIARLEEARDKSLQDLQESRATTPEAKIALLQSRLREAIAKSQDLQDKEGALAAGTEANRLQQEIEGMQRRDTAGGLLRGPGDELLSIGNFLGAGFNTLGGANTAVNELKQINQKLDRIASQNEKDKGTRLEIPS